MTLAFKYSEGGFLSQLSLTPAGSHLSPRLPPKELVLPDHLFSDHVQIMFVQSRGIASTASYLSRDRRPDRSSLIAEKSRSTLTCVTARERRERETTGPHRRGTIG